MKRGLLFAVVLAAVSGCFLRGGLGPGDTAEAEIVASCPRIDQVLSDPETALLEAGLPVRASFNCVSMKLKPGDKTVIQAVARGRFDPAMAVVDGDGAVLAVNDDWAGEVDCRIVLAEVPSGASLLVWGVNGDLGTASVSVTEGTSKDLEEWTAAATLDTGSMMSSLVAGKKDDTMDDLVRDLRGSEIYISDWQNAVLVPFVVAEEGYHCISLESEDFDAYLALISINRGRTRFLAVDDDAGGNLNSKLLLILEPGTYGALVNSYYGSLPGDFRLSVQPFELEEARVTWVGVPGSASGEIAERQLAVTYWPGIDEDYHYSRVAASSPVAGFGFVVERAGTYRISAASEMDCTLTLLSYESPEEACFLDYNDDYDGLDPGLVLDLEPGTYLALVMLYGRTPASRVEFEIEPEVPFVPDTLVLRQGNTINLSVAPRTPYGVFALNIVEGYRYSVSAESYGLDPVITLTFADGSEIYDDDGGSSLNSYAEFVPTAGQIGRAILRVQTYSGMGTGDIAVSFRRIGEN